MLCVALAPVAAFAEVKESESEPYEEFMMRLLAKRNALAIQKLERLALVPSSSLEEFESLALTVQSSKGARVSTGAFKGAVQSGINALANPQELPKQAADLPKQAADLTKEGVSTAGLLAQNVLGTGKEIVTGARDQGKKAMSWTEKQLENRAAELEAAARKSKELLNEGVKQLEALKVGKEKFKEASQRVKKEVIAAIGDASKINEKMVAEIDQKVNNPDGVRAVTRLEKGLKDRVVQEMKDKGDINEFLNTKLGKYLTVYDFLNPVQSALERLDVGGTTTCVRQKVLANISSNPAAAPNAEAMSEIVTQSIRECVGDPANKAPAGDGNPSLAEQNRKREEEIQKDDESRRILEDAKRKEEADNQAQSELLERLKQLKARATSAQEELNNVGRELNQLLP